MKYKFLLLLILIPSLHAQSTTKVICELEGTYSITYEDVAKNYLSEGIDLFRNLAVQIRLICIELATLWIGLQVKEELMPIYGSLRLTEVKIKILK